MAKPATYACQDCEVIYPMGAETFVFLFQRQPWMNYLLTTCPRCNIARRRWYLTEEQIQYMEANNMVEGDEVNWQVEDFADDALVELFASDNDLPPVPYIPQQRVYRSPRAEEAIEKEVAFWVWELSQLPTRKPKRKKRKQHGEV